MFLNYFRDYQLNSMVIGNGLLANAFLQYEDDTSCILFCSGVSNSQCKEQHEFDREFNLLKDTINQYPEAKLIYFSTCSIHDVSLQGSMYIEHKLKIEQYIQSHATKFLIIRLSNVVGFTKNKHTVLNFFFQQILNNIPFTLWEKSYRNLIDIADVEKIVSYILQQDLFSNSILQIANPISTSSLEIVKKIEHYLNKKAIYESIEKGTTFDIDLQLVEPVIKKLHLDFDNMYLDNLLKKYYTN